MTIVGKVDLKIEDLRSEVVSLIGNTWIDNDTFKYFRKRLYLAENDYVALIGLRTEVLAEIKNRKQQYGVK